MSTSFRETEEAAEAEAAEDAQGATQRKARGQEARRRLLSPGRQVDQAARWMTTRLSRKS